MESREQEAELRAALHRSIGDPGTRAMLALLQYEQDRLNRSWMDATGDDLLRMQGDAQSVRKMLRFITVPATK